MESGPHDPAVDEVPRRDSNDDASPPTVQSQSHESRGPSHGQDTASRLTTDELARHDQMLHNQSVLGSSVHHSSATSLDADTDDFNSTLSDLDSAVGSWRSSYTQSLTSSVVDYQYENGRRYHSYREGLYHLPNDEHEQERLDLQHHIYRVALDGCLYLAPLPKERIHDVLDVGCGTGLWCIDLADELPGAQVLGIDLSPIQPDMVPPNCKFLVDDCNSEWVFSQRFDLIHTRAMTAGVKDWPRLMQQAYDHLKPGGYIELQEFSIVVHCTPDTAEPKPHMVKWAEQMNEAVGKAGLDPVAPSKFDRQLQEAGFTNIVLKWQNWPIGPWAKGKKNKEIGYWFAEDVQDGVRNAEALFTRMLGWSSQEFAVAAANVNNEIKGRKKHMWFEMCFAYAQKPPVP